MIIYFDVECYRNYFLVLFMTETGKTRAFEMHEDQPLDCEGLVSLITNPKFEFHSFNGNSYDLPMVSYAATAHYNKLTCDDLKYASDLIIVDNLTPWKFEKRFGIKLLDVNHVDLIEPAPGVNTSLKIYGGRMHTRKMQDLPIEPHATLTREQMGQIKTYCGNDLLVTQALSKAIAERIDLRREMSAEYDVDLRSKSDAQVAEAVLKAEVTRVTGVVPRKSSAVYRSFRYAAPSYIGFKTEQLQGVLTMVTTMPMLVDANGYVQLPDEIEKLVIPIGNSRYKLGIGGLHSQEKSVSHFTTDEEELVDVDVVSYYPNLMLNMAMFPDSLGHEFLTVFRKILNERVAAKKAGKKAVQESLKIVLNGTFGKTSSKYSILYNPMMTVQTTLTGQLSLLMLIEFFERVGIHVVSANTDGIVSRCPRSKRDLMKQIIKAWEQRTHLEMEETLYRSIHSRDVNNYLAIYMTPKKNPDGSLNWVKTKGVFAETSLMKTPQNEICPVAVAKFLCEGVPIEDTIRGCTDIRQFVTVRTVTGGAFKEGYTLGKAIRWYYATGINGTINYIKTGNTVPRTEGAKPLMELPDVLPDDVNYAWYINECEEMLMDIGMKERPVEEKIPRRNSKAWKELLDAGLITVDNKGKSKWVKNL